MINSKSATPLKNTIVIANILDVVQCAIGEMRGFDDINSESNVSASSMDDVIISMISDKIKGRSL